LPFSPQNSVPNDIHLSSWIIGFAPLPSKEKQVKSLPFSLFRGKISAMEKAEIKRIGDYLKDLEEGLYEWDYRGITTLGQLTEVYQIIERLMDATFKADRELKSTVCN